MTKWLEQYKNIVLIIVLILFVILALFFMFLIRPLAADEETKRQELNRINDDVSFYQNHLNELTPQTFTDQEKDLLIGKVPATPNVEEVVKDLEKTEIKTGAVIDNVAISIHQNEVNQVGQSEVNPEAQEGNADGEPATPQGPNRWSHILPEETLKLLEEKEKLKDVNDLTISYVELAIDVNGKVKDIEQFLQEIESFKRITHVQGFDYTINEENGRLEGVLTIRAFYSKDFENVINEDGEFQLDYDFAPSKIKRYIEPVEIVDESGTENNEGNNTSQENKDSTNGDSSKVKEQPSVETPKEDKPSKPSPSHNEVQDRSKTGSTKQYIPPETKREGEPVFLVIQTGAYASTHNLSKAVKELTDIGVYPRIIGDELFYIYTATDSSDDSAQKMVDMLKNKGIDSYVKTLPYRLTTVEKNMLLDEADQVVSTTTEILTDGITTGKYVIHKEQLATVQSKIKSYEGKVQYLIKKGISEERKQELQESLSILTKLDEVLQKTINDGKLETLWEAEGLLLDYMLVLNRYVPADLK